MAVMPRVAGNWQVFKEFAPRLGHQVQTTLGGVGWRGTGGGTDCAAWLQVGGMVLTVAGVVVGASPASYPAAAVKTLARARVHAGLQLAYSTRTRVYLKQKTLVSFD